MNNSYIYKGRLSERTRPTISSMSLVKRGKTMNALLYDLLVTRSPNGHEKAISDIISKFVSGCKTPCDIKVDDRGNLIIRTKQKSSVMFSSHMDVVANQGHGDNNSLFVTGDNYVYAGFDKAVYKFTCTKTNELHTESEIKKLASDSGFDYRYYTIMPRNTRKSIAYVYGTDDMFQDSWTLCGDMAYKVDNVVETVPNVLGADDKLGCYIMCRLLEAGVPGLYVFHIGEECGGIGSTYISNTTPEVVDNMDYCVAFDRMGYNDIITNQSGGRCCSDTFADALAKQMNAKLPPMKQMAKSTGGTFTDSANYTKLIAECTNVAVGYKNQHGTSEYFDHEWLERHLIPSLLNVAWSALPVKRDPKAVVSSYSRYGGMYGSGYSGYGLWGEDEEDYNDYSSVSSPVPINELFKHDPKDNNRSAYQINKSVIHKVRHQVNKRLEEYSTFIGFDDEESQSEKIEKVLLTFYKNDMSLREMAEMVVDAHEHDDDWGTGKDNYYNR